MYRPRLLPSALVAALALAACEGSETDTLERVRSVAMSEPLVLGGGGQSQYIIVLDATGYLIGEPGLRFFRRNYAYSGPAIEEAGTLFSGVGFPPASDAYYSGYGAAFVIGGAVQLVDYMGTPTDDGWIAPSALGVTRAVVHGGDVLTTDGAAIQLVARMEGGPVKVDEFTASSPVTGLLGFPEGFIAFTQGGYIFVDTNAYPHTITEHADPVIRRFQRCYPSDNAHQAMVAGPSSYVGQSRVARLDLADPEFPTIVGAADVEGEYGAFAWDGYETSVLETQGEPGAGLYQGYRLVESSSGFTAAPISLPQWFGGEAHLAAHWGMLFALDPEGMGVYVIH